MFIIGSILINEKLNNKIKDVIRIGQVGMSVEKVECEYCLEVFKIQ